MIKDAFANYDAFYNMVLSTTIMSNARTDEFQKDATKIIDLIARAYKIEEPLILEFTKFVLEDLSIVSLTSDQMAIRSSRHCNDPHSDDSVMMDIKGEVIGKLEQIGQDSKFINTNWFDYGYYRTYEPKIRYRQIENASSTGDVSSTRQMGILKMLGIGCDVNIEEAIRRLFQCVYWGDISAMKLLAYAFTKIGNEEKSKIIYELAEISENYLNAGCTVLPDVAKAKYGDDARNYYVYISTIRQDIVHALDIVNINFSFIEAITSDTLDYFKRMKYINNYNAQDWKDVTNSSEKPAAKKLGF